MRKLMMFLAVVSALFCWLHADNISAETRVACTMSAEYSEDEIFQAMFREINGGSNEEVAIQLAERDVHEAYEIVDHFVMNWIWCGDHEITVAKCGDDEDLGLFLLFVPAQIQQDYEQTVQYIDQIGDIVHSIILPDMSESQRVVAIYDYVRENMRYSVELGARESGMFSVAMNRHFGSCYAYAKLFRALCCASDIHCRIQKGYVECNGETQYHAWNVVMIDEKWCKVDTTWGIIAI